MVLGICRKITDCFLVGWLLDEGLIALKIQHLNTLENTGHHVPNEEKNKITIWNQITMTSGLDDTVDDPFWPNPSCLTMSESSRRDRWAYQQCAIYAIRWCHFKCYWSNIEHFANQRLLSRTGMDGLFYL